MAYKPKENRAWLFPLWLADWLPWGIRARLWVKAFPYSTRERELELIHRCPFWSWK